MSNKQAVKLKKGDFISHAEDAWLVTKTDFYNPGKGSALMKVKIKNISTGKVIDYTYKSNETVDLAEVSGSYMQFLYREGGKLIFMDNESFEQFEMDPENIGNLAGYLTEGAEYYIYVYNNMAVNLNFKGNQKIAIKYTEPAVKGNTANNARKDAELETGAKILVPQFINIGDVVEVNPETEEYIGRVNS